MIRCGRRLTGSLVLLAVGCSATSTDRSQIRNHDASAALPIRACTLRELWRYPCPTDMEVADRCLLHIAELQDFCRAELIPGKSPASEESYRFLDYTAPPSECPNVRRYLTTVCASFGKLERGIPLVP